MGNQTPPEHTPTIPDLCLPIYAPERGRKHNDGSPEAAT
jgi:hypothetical protein